LRDSVVEANHRISDAVERDQELDGMGTTLTALRFAGSQVALVHVGDSRAYLLRGDLLSQITHDDTYVQYLVDSGKLTPDEAKDHPRKSVILRALRGAEVEPDVSIREARAGDRYLLCTDGLSDVVSTETILETLRIPDAQECADRLVELALRGGGPDNVTVIVADVVNAAPGDVIDDMPVVAGAFVDPSAADIPGTDSPAERAAHISRPREAPAQEAPPKRRRWRGLIIALAVLLVVAGGLGGTYAWAQTQYYVGRAGSEVAIYRGVNASFGPLKFSEVYENTDLKLSALTPSARDQVASGITARDKNDARRIVSRLQGEANPPCPPTRSASTSPSASLSSSSPEPLTSSPTTPSSSARRSGTTSSPLRAPVRSVDHIAAPAITAPITSAGTSPSGVGTSTDSTGPGC
jgi:protein phosphatase